MSQIRNRSNKNPDSSAKDHGLHVPSRLRLIVFLSTISYLLLAWPGSALSSSPRFLNLVPNQNIFYMGKYFQYLEDRDRVWGIKDVSGPQLSQQFNDSQVESLNMGMTSSVYWFRFGIGPQINNGDSGRSIMSPYHQQWLLHPGRYLTAIDEVRLYWRDKDNDGEWNVTVGGLQEGIRTGQTQRHYLRLPPFTRVAQPITFYLRVEMKNTLFIKPSMWTMEAYSDDLTQRTLFYGIYFGIVITLIAYNLFMYIISKEKVRILFVCYITCLAFYFMVVDGLGYDYAPPRYAGLIRHGAMMMLLLSISFICWFAKEFLNIRQSSPRVNRLLIVFMWLPLAVFLLAFVMPFPTVVQISIGLGFIATGLLLVCGVVSFIKGYRAARFFMIAYPFFLGGGITFALTYVGLVPFTTLRFYAWQIGSAMEMIILSLAIADRTQLIIEQLNKDQVNKQVQLRALSEKLIKTEERERRLLASELHDRVGQLLMMCKFRLDTMIEHPKEDTVSGVLETRNMLKTAIEDTRSLSSDLCPTTLYDLGLLPALRTLAEKYEQEFGIEVLITGDIKNAVENQDRDSFLYRSVSELLLNVVKHSQALKASVTLEEDEQATRLTVSDPGIGMSRLKKSESDGLGLFSIRERAGLMGGTMSVSSIPKKGTQVMVELPA